MIQKITLSMCTYNDGKFELFIIDPQTGEEVCIDGERKFTDAEHDLSLIHI